MEEKYVPSPEVEEFIKENIDLIEANKWEEVFLKVKKENNKLINEFIYIIDTSDIHFSKLDISKKITNKFYKYTRDEKEFQNDSGQPLELDKLKLFLLKHRVCISIDYEAEKIIVVGIEVRNSNLICETPRLYKLFKQYSNITLEKAKGGGFKDLIHFITFHSIEKIGLKSVDDMIEHRWGELCSDKKYLSKLSKLDLTSVDLNENILLPIKKSFIEKCYYKDLELYQRLGYYSNNEVYLCDNLIKQVASMSSPSDLKKQSESFEQLYKKVFTHEMGHLVFDWVGTKVREKQEKQANYFSSCINDGAMDKFIKDFTKKQPKEYRNPYLKGDTRAEELYIITKGDKRKMALLDDLIKKFREDAFEKNGRAEGQKQWFKDNLQYIKIVDKLYLSIALAHNDMARRAQGHTNEVKKASVVWWYNQFTTNSPFSIKKMSDFDKWHHDACVNFCSYMNSLTFPKKFDTTFGRAQKILNMTFKYLYCTKTYTPQVENILPFLHMTLDGYTLRWYKDNVVPYFLLKKGDVSEWSKMDEPAKERKNHKYIDLTPGADGIQNRIREYLKANSNYEYTINTEVVDIDDEEAVDDTSEKKQKSKLVISDKISILKEPFFAEFIIWEGEIVRAKMESLFKGLNGCYKSWNDDGWAIGKDIKDELKIKMNKIYPYL